MEEKKSIIFKNRSYPISSETQLRTIDKISVVLTPLITAFALYLPHHVRTVLTSVICEEVNALDYYALILLIATLSSSMFAPIVGRLGDLFGRKRIMLISLCFYILGLCVIGISTNQWMLIVGYFLLGVFYVGTTDLNLGLVMDCFSAEKRTKILSYIIAISSLCAIVGPKYVGIMTEFISARKGMMSLSILLVIVWLITFFNIPDIRSNKNVKIDYKGFILFPFAIGPICIALTTGGEQIPWSSPLIPILIIFSIICSIFFYKIEKKEEVPVINFTMISNKTVLSLIIIVFCHWSLLALSTYFNLYCRTILEFSASQLGNLQVFNFVSIIISALVGMYLGKTKNFKAIFTLSSIVMILTPVFYMLFMKPGLSSFGAALLRIPHNIAVYAALSAQPAYLGAIFGAKERGMALSLATSVGNLANALFSSVFAIVFNNVAGGLVVSFKIMCIAVMIIGLLRAILSLTSIKSFKNEIPLEQSA